MLGVLILATFVFIIVGSLLPLSVGDYRMTLTNNLQTAVLGLAEGGAEEGARALKTYTSDADWIAAGWASKTKDGKAYWVQAFDLADEIHGGVHFNLGSGRSGEFRVVVEKPAGVPMERIKVYSEGRVSGHPLNNTISRMVVVELRYQVMPPGFITLDGISASGQPMAASYISSPAFPLPASGVNTGSNVTLGSVSTNSGSLSLGNMTVQGNVVSKASDPVGEGVLTGNPNISGQIIGDVDFDFPPVERPDTSGWATSF